MPAESSVIDRKLLPIWSKTVTPVVSQICTTHLKREVFYQRLKPRVSQKSWGGGGEGLFWYFIHTILIGMIGKQISVYFDEIMLWTKKGVTTRRRW